MSRYAGWHDNAAVQRLLGQNGTSARVPVKPRPQPIFGAHRPAFSRVERTETGYVLTWINWLPKINGHQVNRFARSRLAKMGRQVFGSIPRACCMPRFAYVQVFRVLGPRQKPMDRDSMAALTAGLLDSLQPLYLWNDSERYADIQYRNDGTRRQAGPAIEIHIVYEEPQP